jgi:hypothetical protein
MMNPEVVLAGLKIPIPEGAAIPVVIGVVALLLLIFGGIALKGLKAKNPRAASVVGSVIAAALSCYALYMAATIIPASYIDRGPSGARTLGFLDGPLTGFSALIGTLFWWYANQRRIALGFGGGIGAALFLKPFIVPLHSWWSGDERQWSFMDPEHLSFHGPGVAVLIAALIAGLSKRR